MVNEDNDEEQELDDGTIENEELDDDDDKELDPPTIDNDVNAIDVSRSILFFSPTIHQHLIDNQEDEKEKEREDQISFASLLTPFESIRQCT